MPKLMRVDASKEFQGEFLHWRRESDTLIDSAAAGGHWQVGAVERANALIKNHYFALCESNPRKNKNFLLQMSFGSHNQLPTHRGLPPAVRVFGFVPRVPTILEVRNENSLDTRPEDHLGTWQMSFMRQKGT